MDLLKFYRLLIDMTVLPSTQFSNFNLFVSFTFTPSFFFFYLPLSYVIPWYKITSCTKITLYEIGYLNRIVTEIYIIYIDYFILWREEYPCCKHNDLIYLRGEMQRVILFLFYFFVLSRWKTLIFCPVVLLACIIKVGRDGWRHSWVLCLNDRRGDYTDITSVNI